MADSEQGRPTASAWLPSWVEVALIFVLFFVVAGGIPPDVNEAHYLAKARHYWDPDWCKGDLFLESADAHLCFYWTVGILTSFLSLEATAWVGRAVAWWLLAWSWQRMSRGVVPGPLVSLLTAGLFVTAQRWGHMAGEWVVGGVEAKCLAYAFVFMALTSLAADRWGRVWLLLGVACSFHVLVGGWSAVAAVFAWCAARQRPSWRTQVLPLCAGLLLALPGILPAVALTSQADAATVRDAGLIQVFDRLDHHLVWHRLPPSYVARHGALLLAWLGMLGVLWRSTRCRRIYLFVVGAVLIATCGVLLDQLLLSQPAVAARLLRFYWFRLSDAMLPLGIALAATELIRRGERRPVWGSLGLAAAIVLVAASVTNCLWVRWRDPRPGAVVQVLPVFRGNGRFRLEQHRSWVAACRWIAAETPTNALILTPRQQQTFKWYAGRAEVVNWKDVPQDAARIVEWRDRMREVYPLPVQRRGLAAHSTAELRRLAQRYGFEYLVLDRAESRRPLAFPRLFPEPGAPHGFYEVYRIPPAEGRATAVHPGSRSASVLESSPHARR